MEKVIKKSFNQDILNTAIERYGFEKGKSNNLNGFQSFVYECYRNGESFILRITHSSHRSLSLIKAELDWIYYLFNSGVPVCIPVLSKNRQPIETIRLRDFCYFVVAFEKARGGYLPACEWSPSLIQKWGQITGYIHALSKYYNPRDNFTRRMEWYEVDNYNVDKHLPACQIKIKNRLHTLLKKISTFSRDRDSFGLIHADLRAGNISIYHDEISIFDFDGCMYSWFIHDIAIILFTAIRFSYDINDRKLFAHNFIDNFLKGYNRENTISHTDRSKFQDFLLLEEIGEYNLIYRSCDLSNLNTLDRQFMDKRRYNIENNVPYIDFNFCGEPNKN